MTEPLQSPEPLSPFAEDAAEDDWLFQQAPRPSVRLVELEGVRATCAGSLRARFEWGTMYDPDEP